MTAGYRDMNVPELVAPAGNPEKLTTAIHYGADAVFLGLSEFSLRARAGNFTERELEEAVRLVHREGKKAYVTVNIIPHNRDFSSLRKHLLFLKHVRPDAIIMSDPGLFELATVLCPDIPLHVSTQANITNFAAAQFWERMGADRLILSRELSIDEIREIRDRVSLGLECFVHGAICISYSGRCYISSFEANRPANRGECTNSCRWNYTLMEEKRPGEYAPVFENDRGTYILSSRDLCMIEHIGILADAGVNSFKIEGRMKGVNYVAGVVKVYREAIDSLRQGPFQVQQGWLRELSEFSNRGYTTGMFFGPQPGAGYNHDEVDIGRMSHDLVGIVRSVGNGRGLIALRTTLQVGDAVQFLSPGLEQSLFNVIEMYDEDGTPIISGRNQEIVSIPMRPEVRANDLVRRPL